MKYKIGDLCEGLPWEIKLDEKVSIWSGITPCRHCHTFITETKNRHDGGTYDNYYVTCPRVVIAKNEGGYASTMVCLDCILEAERTLTEAREHEST